MTMDDKTVVWWALSQVGVKEDPGRKNRGPKVDEYIRAGGLEPEQGAFAWCCGYVCWVLEQAGVRHPVTCSVERWERLAREQGWTSRFDPEPGDVAIHLSPTGNHCGIVETAEGPSTVEGNSNEEGSREGNAVVIHERPVGYWSMYLRPPQ